MPSPILEIPIDDKDFKAFIETFKGYQDALKDQPDIWSGVGTSIQETVGVANDFADSLKKQQGALDRITRAESELDRKRDDAGRKSSKRRDDDERHEERANTRRRRVLDQVREYSRNIGEVARKGGGLAVGAIEGELGSIGGGAAGLFGAAGGALGSIPYIGGILGGATMAGFAVMQNMSSARQNAHGLGVNVQTLQGWNDALGPFLPSGSAEHLLSTVSQAQASPGGGGLFARFGIKNAGNRDVSDISAEMLTHAQSYLKSHPGQRGLWGAQALYGGALDTGTLRTLQGMSPKELQEHLSTAKKFATDHNDAEATALKLTKDLSSAELTATGTVDNFGGAVASAAGQVTEAFKSLYGALKPYLDALGKAAPAWKDFESSVSTGAGVGGAIGGPAGALIGGAIAAGAHVIRAGYNAVVGNVTTIPGGASSHTLGELSEYDRIIRSGARALGLGDSSALGQYQIVGETRERVGKALWGSNWASQKFDAAHQEQMARYIWEHDARYGDAHAVFATLRVSGKGAYSRYSFDQIRNRLARGEGGLPQSDTGHVARAVAEGVRKGTIQANGHIQHGGAHVKVKVEQKPGSDVTVAARQMAGR